MKGKLPEKRNIDSVKCQMNKKYVIWHFLGGQTLRIALTPFSGRLYNLRNIMVFGESI